MSWWKRFFHKETAVTTEEKEAVTAADVRLNGAADGLKAEVVIIKEDRERHHETVSELLDETLGALRKSK